MGRDSSGTLVCADGPLQRVVPLNDTRRKARHWKTGLHHIALTGQVPIVLAYVDDERKVSGLGPVFQPTGDVDADMAAIKRFYAAIEGRNATHFEAG